MIKFLNLQLHCNLAAQAWEATLQDLVVYTNASLPALLAEIVSQTVSYNLAKKFLAAAATVIAEAETQNLPLILKQVSHD